jgi:hypothetical protein
MAAVTRVLNELLSNRRDKIKYPCLLAKHKIEVRHLGDAMWLKDGTDYLCVNTSAKISCCGEATGF